MGPNRGRGQSVRTKRSDERMSSEAAPTWARNSPGSAFQAWAPASKKARSEGLTVNVTVFVCPGSRYILAKFLSSLAGRLTEALVSEM